MKIHSFPGVQFGPSKLIATWSMPQVTAGNKCLTLFGSLRRPASATAMVGSALPLPCSAVVQPASATAAVGSAVEPNDSLVLCPNLASNFMSPIPKVCS